MGLEVDGISTCPQLGCLNQVEQFPGCDKHFEEKKKALIDNDLSDYTSSDSEDEDESHGSQFPPENFSFCRFVVKGKKILKVPMNSYFITIKDEYKPKGDLDRKQYCISLLERVVDMFGSEAFRGLEKNADFEALLTEEENRKLCGMKEVATVTHVQYVTR